MSPPLVTWKFWIFFLLPFISHGYPFGLEARSLVGRKISNLVSGFQEKYIRSASFEGLLMLLMPMICVPGTLRARESCGTS